MNEFLKNILPRIKAFSQEVNIIERIIDKPWIWVTEIGVNQKLVFRRDGELLMVNDGNVITGKWEFISSLNSFLIDRNVDKILMNYTFFNESIMLLKKDGSMNDEIIAFVNQNDLPNLDYKGYLLKLIDNPQASLSLSPSIGTEGAINLPVFKEDVKINFNLEHVNLIIEVYAYFKPDFNVKSNDYRLFNYVSTAKNQIFKSGQILKDGYYKMPDHVFNNIPIVHRHRQLLFYVKNGCIIETFDAKVYRYHKKAIDVYQFGWGDNLLRSAAFHSNTFSPIKDGKYQLEFLVNITVCDGRVIKHSTF